MITIYKNTLLRSNYDYIDINIGIKDELASLLFGKHVLVGGMFGVSPFPSRKEERY